MSHEIEEVLKGALLKDYPKPILIEDLGMMFPTETSKKERRFGLYKCGFCGTEFKGITQSINSGNTKSCGCYNKQILTKHGLRYTRIYSIWRGIKGRIINPKATDYANYGGRGITLCEEWLDITVFNSWAMENGYSDDLSIDRIDNDKGYYPENCRWATPTIQARNQRMPKDNTSGFKGVSFNTERNRYHASIMVNKKSIHLGVYLTAVEGGIAYNNYIIENNLEGFILNEVPDEYKK